MSTYALFIPLEACMKDEENHSYFLISKLETSKPTLSGIQSHTYSNKATPANSAISHRTSIFKSPQALYPTAEILQFTASLFTIARKWQQPGCPPADEWMMKTVV